MLLCVGQGDERKSESVDACLSARILHNTFPAAILPDNCGNSPNYITNTESAVSTKVRHLLCLKGNLQKRSSYLPKEEMLLDTFIYSSMLAIAVCTFVVSVCDCAAYENAFCKFNVLYKLLYNKHRTVICIIM